MFQGSPNTPRDPYAPRFPQKSRLYGSNPYQFGAGRYAGKLALQRNVPGMPTNTVPLPQMQQPRVRPPYRMTLGGY